MSLTVSTMEEIEEEAKAAAEKMVINMMQRPGQLEKVEQYKKRITHKKASIEAQLKSAVQGKLDGVSVGLKQLQECLDDVQEIGVKMDELEELLKGVPPLVASLQAVREEDSRHSQYVTAMDSLKHIFTVPDSVAKAMQWIGEGKLLHAHQCLSDLENSRDDLLYELHRLPNQSSHDKIMLKAYFEDVEMVSNSLEKQIKLILARTLNTVRKEPTVIVTALRIIEREEKRDQMALEQQSQTGFMPPGRPKNWRTIAFEELERAVAQRTEGTRVDEREDNKLWLVRYLELTRQLILEDLRVVKTLCVPCFPPHYDIVNKYVNMYHTCLSSSLQGVVDSGLEGNEYVTLLSWVLNTYPGAELMGSPELNIDVSALPPLLSEESLQELQDEYLQKMESNYMEWMEKTLESERAEWNGERAPEVEPHSSAYHTHAPVIIFQMIDQNLQVTQTISKEITFKALMLSIEQVTRYGNMYREGVLQFKNTHFSDRSRVVYFTHHMITIVNNSEQMVRLAQQTQARHWPPGRHDAPAERKFDTLLDTFQKLRDEAAQFLLDEAFLDLEVHFDDLFTPKWLTSSIPVDTICVTLEDYFQDYNHLREKNFEYVINEAQNLVYKKYVTAMLSKKVTFKTVEEAQQAATKIVKEANQIRSFFRRIGAEGVNVDWPFEVISTLAEVLRCQDIEMLSLDLHGVLDKCPDMSEEQLVRLLWLRGDVPRAHVRDTAAHVMSTRKPPRAPPLHSLFKCAVGPKAARSKGGRALALSRLNAHRAPYALPVRSLHVAMFRALSLVLCLVAVTHQLEITNFTVPPAVETGSDTQLVCSHDGKENVTIVKWFWSPDGPDSRQQIYQQMFGGKKRTIQPHEGPIFNITWVKDRHDLMLWNLQPVHSGSFECQVEEQKENSQERKSSSYMVVYTIGDGPQMSFEGDDEVEVTCEAAGVAPKPDVYITYDRCSETEMMKGKTCWIMEEKGYTKTNNIFNTTLVVGPENGLYNASTNATLSKQDIDGVEISCSLSFQDDDIPTLAAMKVSQVYHSDAWYATSTDAPEETTELLARLEAEQTPDSGRRIDAAWALVVLATLLRALL